MPIVMARLEINGKWFESTIVCINTMSNSKDMSVSHFCKKCFF